ncbi:RNA-guided endonuclease InsQ/TnpB family protein [Coleofasciculus sp. F4-SAH-05]|uniref:RNA-guided endonuclease InsQ/TnpB family protein n=1 Tax=Coleofasciculus sp. F4-SAH-05 TaxID=3069525 RepID=UPI004063F33F
MELKRSKDTFKLNYQYRIVPDKRQVCQLNEWLYKLCRIHNLMLEERFNWWECNRNSVNACPIFITYLPELKDQPTYYSQKRATHWSRKTYNYLYEGVHSQVIQEAIKRVEDTFNRFVKGDLNGKRSGKPRFKSVRRYRTISIPQLKADCLSVTVNPHRRKNGCTRRDIAYINLPKVGQVKLIYHRPIPVGFTIKAALVSHKADGWYATLTLEDKTVPSLKLPEIEATEENSIGLDVGLEKFWTASDGEVESIQQHYRKSESKLAKLANRKDKKPHKSAQARKLAKKISKHHQKLQRKRKQFHYQSATKLVSRDEQVFFVEDIKPGNLSRKNKAKQDENGRYLPNGQSAKSGLNKSINDAGWGQFLSILAYKAAKAGRDAPWRVCTVVKVKPHDTSQICSCCNRFEEKDLSIRIHECLCGLVLDRDWNAAINIKRVGLGMFPTIKRRKRSRKAATKEAYTVISDSV